MNIREDLQHDPLCEASWRFFGIRYIFPWQRLIIAAVLDAILSDSWRNEQNEIHSGEEWPEPLRQIAVLPTGAGKSLCWMLPALMIPGISIAVFPLLSLMTDQQRRLEECGIPSITLKGGQSKKERESNWACLERGESSIILANPEILQSPSVKSRLESIKPSLLVIDETHTVSQWGESFRPACAQMAPLIREWNPPAVLALTATAGPQIRERIRTLLFDGQRPHEALADPDRPEIRYGVIPTLSRFHTLERLIRQVKRPAIVFGSTRPSVEQAARILRFRLRDTRICFYHAGLSTEEKRRIEQWFMKSDDGVLCATCAYGMGVDKSNIRSIIHLAPPSSAEAYLQEAGRASRDRKGADAWLISTSDKPIEEHLPDNIAAIRKQNMLRYASSCTICRREMLLEALGIEIQDCSGCDVCSGQAWQNAPEEEVILQVLRWNQGRFTVGRLARILIGRKSSEVRMRALERTRGFGALGGWELEDAEEAVHTLIRREKVQYGRRRKQLYINRKNR